MPSALAAVPEPIARMVTRMSSHHDTLVCTTAFSCTAPRLATTIGVAIVPNLTSNVNVPGVVTMLLMRPAAVMRSTRPTSAQLAGRIARDPDGSSDVGVVDAVSAPPSASAVISVSTHPWRLTGRSP